MSTPFVGEIRLLPYFRGAPEGWLVCDGSLQQIGTYQMLFSLLSTTYGGDGNSTFGIPDLRSRVPVHQGAGTGLTPRSLGEAGGSETVTLQTQQMGAHNHYALASTTVGTSNSPAGTVLAGLGSGTFYNSAPGQAEQIGFPANMLQPSGTGGAHDNTAPTQTLQYCIATDGQYPAKP